MGAPLFKRVPAWDQAEENGLKGRRIMAGDLAIEYPSKFESCSLGKTYNIYTPILCAT